MSLLTYIACPYAHQDESTKLARFHLVSRAAAILLKAGHHVYSPITHCHPIAVAGGITEGWDFWRRHDRAFLEHSGLMVVLMLDGWEQSVGVKGELEIAEELRIPVIYRTMEEVITNGVLPIPE